MNRRSFLLTLPVAVVPGVVLAQIKGNRAPSRDPILEHIARESARIQSDFRRRGIRSELLAALSSNLRLGAAYGKEHDIDRVIQNAARQVSRDRFIAYQRDHDMREHSKAEIARQFPGLEIDAPALPVAATDDQYESALSLMQANGGFVFLHERLAQITSEVAAKLERYAKLEGGAVIRPVQVDECYLYQNALMIARMMADAICLFSAFDPMLLPVCAVIQIEVWTAQILVWWYCGF